MEDYTDYEKFLICCAVGHITNNQLEDPLSRKEVQSTLITSSLNTMWESIKDGTSTRASLDELLNEGKELDPTTMQDICYYQHKYSNSNSFERAQLRNSLANYVKQTKYILVTKYFKRHNS